jgi:FecR-like protein
VSDEYLWDRTGPADADIERLEALLGPLGKTSAPASAPHRSRPRPLSLTFLAAAAALFVICSGAVWVARHATHAPSWEVVRVTGRPEVGGSAVGGSARLGVGEWLQTDAAARASLSVADVGRLDVDPDTRLRLVSSRDGQHRLQMTRGTVHASIWAPPGEFIVDTAASTAVDLGCAYTLHVEPSGAGTIDVESGWVGFTHDGREAFIPAGARCFTKPHVGPGTPFYHDFDSAARDALTTIDFSTPDPEARARALAVIVQAARRPDALTLWHLLARVPAPDRAVVFDALARLVPAPAGVTREGILDGNAAMRDRWWDALDLGGTSWWRMWERQWRG